MNMKNRIVLGELCNLNQGQINVEPDKLIDYIDISSVDKDEKCITGFQTMPFSEAPSRARKNVKLNNILVSTVRPNLNAVAIYEQETPNKAVASTGFCVLDCKNNVDCRFIFYYCRSKSFIDDMVAQATGASYPAVNDRIVKSAMVPIYSYEEQCAISKKLDAISSIINKRHRQLQQLDELVKSRFVELFGDPNTNPMNWQKEQFQCNATLLNGRAYKQDELLDDGKYPVLRVGNFFSNRGWYYSNLELDDDKYCDDGDLLYAWSASFGPRIWNGGKVIYHYHIWKVLVGKNYNKYFLCNLLEYATASFMGGTHGIGMMHLTKSGMEETEFIVPPIDLQNDFADFVKEIDKSKFVVQKALDEAQTLFDCLMQEYFG